MTAITKNCPERRVFSANGLLTVNNTQGISYVMDLIKHRFIRYFDDVADSTETG